MQTERCSSCGKKHDDGEPPFTRLHHFLAGEDLNYFHSAKVLLSKVTGSREGVPCTMEYFTNVVIVKEAIVWSKCISEVLFQLGLTVPTAKDSTKPAAEMVNAMPDVRQGLQWLARELSLIHI